MRSLPTLARASAQVANQAAILWSMAQAWRRDFSPKAAPTWRLTTQGAWSVNPAWAVFSAAYAVRRAGGPASLTSVVAEACLLLGHVRHSRWSPLSAAPSWHASPPHLSGFLSESLGLALTVGHIADYGWTPTQPLVNLDAIPAAWSWLKAPGPRPDFVYLTPGGLRVAEARGRWSAPGVTPTPEQVRRAAQVDTWSKWAGLAAGAARPSYGSGTPLGWSMCWAHIAPAQTVVDIFDPGEALALDEDDQEMFAAAADAVSDGILLASADDGSRRIEAFGGEAAVAALPIVGNGSGQPVTWVVAAVLSRDTVVPDRTDAPEPGGNGGVTLLGSLLGRRLLAVVVEDTDGQLSDASPESLLQTLLIG